MEFVPTIKISSGSCFASHNMFLCENGDLYAFGKNDFGQCGLGTTEDVNVPTKVMNNPNIVSIQLGVYHSLILENNGDLYVCGLNLNSEFGSQYDANITKFVKIAEKVKKVRVSKFTMIQTFDDKIYFIGLFMDEMHNTFTEIKIDKVKNFYLGADHCLFLRDEGEIYVLGSNNCGQLGLGTEKSYTYFPALLTQDTSVVTIVCGYEHTIIVYRTEDGVVLKCIGSNVNGELGFTDPENQFLPVTLSDYPDIKSIHSGSYHTLILRKNILGHGDVYSTGSNDEGQLCLGTKKSVSQFTKVDLSDVEYITTGEQHTLLLTQKGELYVCGSNDYGQLGLGDDKNRNTPTKLEFDQKVKLLHNSEIVILVNKEENEEEKK